MCLGDWRLGRFLRTEIKSVFVPDTAVGGVPQLLCDFNRQRVGLLIASGEPAQLPTPQWVAYVSVQGDHVTQNRILTFDAPTSQLYLTLRNDGDIVQGRFLGAITGDTSTVTIIQWIMPEAWFKAGINILDRLGYNVKQGLHNG